MSIMIENPVIGDPAEMPSSKPLENARSLSVALIDPPGGLNPRRDFGDLASLAASIASIGLLEPVIVRTRGRRWELIAGERRFRAVQSLAWKRIDACVREINDREAAEIRLLENRDRDNLNCLEEATAFRILLDLGHTPESLAELIRETETVVNDRLTLLTLPDAWQTRVRNGELSAAAADALVPWVDRAPRVLDAMLPHLKTWPMPISEWKRRITDAVLTLSRSVDPKEKCGPKFPLTAETLRALDVVTVDVGRGTVRRALNCGLFDELADRHEGIAADDDPAAPAATRRAPRAESNGSRNGKAAGDREQQPATGHYGEPVLNDDDEAEENFRLKVAEWKAAWFRRVLTERIAAMPLAKLEDVAGQCGPLFVDVNSEWRLCRDFLALFDEPRLDDLAQELSIDVSDCHGPGEKRAVMLHAAPAPVPKDFRYAADPQRPGTARTA